MPNPAICLGDYPENLPKIAAFGAETTGWFGNWFPPKNERSSNFWCLGWLVLGASVKVALEQLN